MRDPKLWIAAVIGYWLCGGCQVVAAGRFEILSVPPDFLIALTCVLGLMSNSRVGMILGAIAGILMGGITGANMWQYVLSRMLVGYSAGWIADQRFQTNPAVAGAASLIGTLVGQLVLMFIAPPAAILPFLTATIGSAIYNGVIGMVFCVIIEKLVPAKSR